jgi:hypothetical protein
MSLELAALLIAALFLSSGMEHAKGRARFATALSAYRLIPGTFAWLAATSVIGIELVGAGLVVAGGQPARIGLLFLAGIALGGSALMAFDLAAGHRSHGCGCFSVDADTLSWPLQARSGVIGFAAVGVSAALPSETVTPLVIRITVLVGLAFAWSVLFATLRVGAIAHDRP